MNNDELNSNDFVARLRSGDIQAFADLVERFGSKLCNVLTANVGLSFEDAEQVVSDSFMKVHGSIQRFSTNGSALLTTWITKIAINTAKDFLRKAQTEFNQKAQVMAADAQTGDTQLLFDVQSKADWSRQEHSSFANKPNRIGKCLDAMESALERLPEKDRNLLRLRTIYSYEEIAQIENEPAGRLRIRHMRAFERLRTEINKDMNL
jgi:RNA polymerase sigma factor (sigma-70 family)